MDSNNLEVNDPSPQSPDKNPQIPDDQLSAEQLRSKYINHESELKSLGSLYVLSGILFIMASVFNTSIPGFSICAVIMGIFQLFLGVGIKQLQPWVRTPILVFSTIGLILLPLGTVINAYVLYLVYSKKGGMMFSDQYKSAIDNTPQIKDKTSKIAWVLMSFLCVCFITAMIWNTGN